MKKYLKITALLLLLACPALADGIGIAAVVNSDVITNTDVQGRYIMGVSGANIKPSPEEQKTLMRQALDSLIDEQIRLQEAKRLNVIPPKKEIDDAFARLAQQNNKSPEEFKKLISQNPGVYSSLRQQIKAQIAWQSVIKKKIRPQINITETDINAYLAEREKNPAKVEYNVAEIFLRNDENKQKLASQLVSEMRAGKQRFPLVARQFSEGLEASKGGSLGWIPENRLDPAMGQALQTIKTGQITDPIISPRGIHIFLLREKRNILQLAEGNQRINLKQIVIPMPPEMPPEVQAKMLAQANFLHGQAKDCDGMDATIKKINTPQVARDMGTVRLSELPATIAGAVKDLPIGQISDVIRGESNIGLFMVCKRDESQEDTLREDVANTLGTERLNRLQYRYYRDLRAAAYVDIK